MGCSASRLDSLMAKAIEDPSFSLSPHNSCTSFSSSSSTKATSSSSSSSATSSAISKPRSLAAPLVHHPALGKGDTHHLVSLTSSTYGSLIVVDNHPSSGESGDYAGQSSPDSVINTWELMEGLEDEGNFSSDSGKDFKLKSLSCCDFKDARAPNSTSTLRLGLNFTDSFSTSNKLSDSYVFVEMPQGQGEKLGEGDSNSNNLNSKPLWKLLSEESLLSKMDPNVVSSYQRALSTRNLGYNHNPTPCSRVNKPMGSSPFGPTRSKSVESSPLVSKLSVNDNDNDSANDNANASKGVACGEDKIVLYFTSLRGIRRTYEDCSAVRLILRGFRVMIDERDISMDSTYKKELQSALGGRALSLPHLFVRGKHIGGADEIKQLHETGELERLLDGFPVQDCRSVCEICGDARFIPCSSCNGSRKVFLKEEGQTNPCPDCNENGLIHCPGCCS